MSEWITHAQVRKRFKDHFCETLYEHPEILTPQTIEEYEHIKDIMREENGTALSVCNTTYKTNIHYAFLYKLLENRTPIGAPKAEYHTVRSLRSLFCLVVVTTSLTSIGAVHHTVFGSFVSLRRFIDALRFTNLRQHNKRVCTHSFIINKPTRYFTLRIINKCDMFLKILE